MAEPGHVVVSYMTSINQITYINQSGSMTIEELQEMTDLCLDGCSKVIAVWVCRRERVQVSASLLFVCVLLSCVLLNGPVIRLIIRVVARRCYVVDH